MLVRLPSSQQILLQWIALVVMTLDHYVMIFHDASHWIHYLSRFVYPMFAYLVVYNYLYRTSNQLKYLGRLLLWGVISQPFYSWAFDFPFYKLNILFTLFLGLVFLYGHAYLKANFHSHLALVLSGYFIMGLLFLGLGFFVSYYWFGLVLLATFAYYFQNPSTFNLVYIAMNVTMLNVISGNLILALCALSFFLIVIASAKVTPESSITRLPGWIFYLYYPTHLAVLGFIHQIST